MARLRKTLTAGLGLAAAAAAGAYFIYERTSKERRQLRGWMLRMKGEVMEKLEKMKEVNEETYKETVEKVAKRYRKVKEINSQELEGMITDLRGAWGKFQGKIHVSEKKPHGNGHGKTTHA